MRTENLRTVKQMVRSGPWTESALRGLIYAAEDNGLATAIVRVGRRVLIDKRRFEEWLEEQRGGNPVRKPT